MAHEGQSEGEYAAPPQFAHERYLASVEIDEALGECQSEPCPALFPGDGGVELPECFEGALVIGLGDANPGVAHRDLDRVGKPLCVYCHQPAFYRRPAA